MIMQDGQPGRLTMAVKLVIALLFVAAVPAWTLGQSESTVTTVVVADDEEPDDAFLNAALAKARRLNRLYEMKEKKAMASGRAAEAVRIARDEGRASAQVK